VTARSRNRVWRGITATLALAILAPPAGAATRPRYGGEIVRGHVGLVATVDPLRASSTIEREVARQLHAGLFAFDRQGEPLPDLVERAEIEAGGTEVRLFLRSARFHDGGMVRAEDALAAIERLATVTSAASLMRGDDPEVPTGRVVGARELVLAVGGAPVLWPWILADVRAAVLPGHGDGSVGAGPFRLAARTRGELRLEAYLDHHRGRPLFDAAIYRSFRSARALRLGFRRGEIDAIDEPGPVADVGASRGAIGEIIVLRVNAARSPFERQSVRDALRRALHLDALVDVVLRGGAEKAQGLLRLRPELDRIGSVESAALTVALDGEVALLFVAGVGLDNVAERLRVDLHAAGLKSRPKALSAHELAGAVTDHLYELALVALPSVRLPPALQLVAAADLLARTPASLVRAVAEVDPWRAGGVALHQAEAALLDDAELVVLFRRQRHLVAGPTLHDLSVAPDGTLRLEDAWRWPAE